MNNKTIFIGSNNQGKILEFSNSLTKIGISLITPKELGLVQDIPETAHTFKRNAILKSRTWARLSSLPTLVDDSGLCIDALDGQPGIYSARYAPGTDQNRNEKVLMQLKDVPIDQRTAHYICVIAFVDPILHIEHIADGICYGYITQSPQGSYGFGYDPIFQPVEYNQTFGQLPLEVKQKISHRAKALASMMSFLREWKQM